MLAGVLSRNAASSVWCSGAAMCIGSCIIWRRTACPKVESSLSHAVHFHVHQPPASFHITNL
jgi:hypothetical protein